jgi:hypothetical protein
MKKCYAQCNTGGLKYTNGVSTKMMQSKMINTNGKQKIPYSNSKTNTIKTIILSADYKANMNLLLCLKYSGYIRYFEPLKNNKLVEIRKIKKWFFGDNEPYEFMCFDIIQ